MRHGFRLKATTPAAAIADLFGLAIEEIFQKE
jgi:DNA-binding XRE family transcriptional regulator